MDILTFEEDKFAFAVLVNSVNLSGQTPPEDTDEHGIAWHYCIVTNPPEPVVLKKRQRIRIRGK